MEWVNRNDVKREKSALLLVIGKIISKGVTIGDWYACMYFVSNVYRFTMIEDNLDTEWIKSILLKKFCFLVGRDHDIIWRSTYGLVMYVIWQWSTLLIFTLYKLNFQCQKFDIHCWLVTSGWLLNVRKIDRNKWWFIILWMKINIKHFISIVTMQADAYRFDLILNGILVISMTTVYDDVIFNNIRNSLKLKAHSGELLRDVSAS